MNTIPWESESENVATLYAFILKMRVSDDKTDLDEYSERMTKTHLTITVPDAQHNLRLDVALSQLFPDYSRGQHQAWIKDGCVLINNIVETKPKKTVHEGDQLSLTMTAPEVLDAKPQEIPLSIVFEDEHLLIINKPIGLVVHPGAGNPDSTLVNALLHYCPALNAIPRAGVVHRLDKDTSGLLIIAKTLKAHHKLIKAMQRRDIHREYQALVQGQLISGGTIDACIGRHATQRTKMCVTDSGREAITHYRILKRFTAHTLLSVQLETGRTHQIRVHLAHKGFSIVGDKTYGKFRRYSQLSDDTNNALMKFSHQALHAYRLALTHPITGETLECTAPLPQDFESLLDSLV